MKFIKIFFILLTLTINSSLAQEGLDNPITKAMMNVYQQQLEEDPAEIFSDYRILCFPLFPSPL